VDKFLANDRVLVFEIAVKSSKGGKLGNKYPSNNEDDLCTSQNASGQQQLMLSQCRE
jgi:hypothetical protein